MSNWTYDASYRMTSPFGMRRHPITGKNTFHRGVDLVVTPGNGPLYAFVAGKVVYAKEGAAGIGIPREMGIVVAIKDDKGYLHVYAHLSAAVVKVGQTVQRGQMIGRQGTTGASTGNHLHYEIRKVATPHYGWTATEVGVVEPTSYLQNYYKEKEDEPMTKEEKKQFEELQKKLEKQAARIEKLEKLVPAPAWFIKEFGSADLNGKINNPLLTNEGWRVLTISLRSQSDVEYFS